MAQPGLKRQGKIGRKNAQSKANARAARINPVLEEDFSLSRSKLDISELMTDAVFKSQRRKKNVSVSSPSKKTISSHSPPMR